MPVVFFKSFNIFFMNGFINSKSEKAYWISSYISIILFAIGFFLCTRNNLLFSVIQNNDNFDMAMNLAINGFFYFSLFSVLSTLPIIIHWLFKFGSKNNFSYFYAKYMWRKEKTNILNILTELPPEIITQQEISFLSSSNIDLEEQQVQILRKIWERNLTYVVRYYKKMM